MLNWAHHQFTSLPILRPLSTQNPHQSKNQKKAHQQQQLNEITRATKFLSNSTPVSILETIHDPSPQTHLHPPPFRPHSHNLNTQKDKVQVKLQDAITSKPLGTFVIPCGTSLLTLRNKISGLCGEFLFLSSTSNNNSVDVVFLDERFVKVGSYCPLKTLVLPGIDAHVKGGVLSNEEASLSSTFMTTTTENPETDTSSSKPSSSRLGLFNLLELASATSYLLPPNTHSTNLATLEQSFKLARRAKSAIKIRVKGEVVLNKINSILATKELTLQEWFNTMDSNPNPSITPPKQNDKPTVLELRRGLKLLTSDLEGREFKENQVINLLSYINPHSFDVIKVEDFEQFAKLAQMTSLGDQVQDQEQEQGETKRKDVGSEINTVLYRLDEEVKRKGIKLSELFEAEGITGEDLMEGLVIIADPTKRGRNKKKEDISDKKDMKYINKNKNKESVISCIIKVREQVNYTNTNDQTITHKPPPQPPVSIIPEFLDIANAEITSLCKQIGNIYPYPLSFRNLLQTINSIPQIKAVNDNLNTSWSINNAKKADDTRVVGEGSAFISDEALSNVLNFLDPNKDGEIDREELNEAFKLVRRGKAGIVRRRELAESLKVGKKAVSKFEVLAEKGARILEEQARVASEEARKREECKEAEGKKKMKKNTTGKTDEENKLQTRSVIGIKSNDAKFIKDHQKNGNHSDHREKEPEKELFGGFDSFEIDVVTAFMDPSQKNQILLDDLLIAFRKSRRAKAQEKDTKKGRVVLNRILNMTKILGLTLDALFELFDSAGEAQSDGNISGRELMLGVERMSGMCIAKLHKEYKEEEAEKHIYQPLRISECVLVMKVSNPSGNGSLTRTEFEQAINNLQMPTISQKIEMRVGRVFAKLELVMNQKGLRLQDFFELFGGERGYITSHEMKEGLKELTKDSGKERSDEKRAIDAAMKKKGDDEKQRNSLEFEIQRIQMAEDSGAGDVLRRFEVMMKVKQIRISDVFRKLDKSGDGVISRDELADGLRLFTEPSANAMFAKKKALEKEIKEQQAEVLKRSKLRHFLARQKACIESGADKVIDKLSSYCRSHQLRIPDLFKSIDTSGDGSLDASELGEMFKKVHLQLTASELEKLVKFLDSGGDGLVEAAELTDAIRQYRRYTREAKTIDVNADCRLPLHEEYFTMSDIFHSNDVFAEELTESDVEIGLRRLRGDDMMSETNVLTSQQKRSLRGCVDKLAKHMRREDIDLRKVKVGDFESFLTKLRTRVGGYDDDDDDGTNDTLEGSITSMNDMDSIGSYEFGTISSSLSLDTLDSSSVDALISATVSSTSTSNNNNNKIKLHDQSFVRVADFLDCGDGRINLIELEEAFRMSRRSKVDEEIKKEGEVLMKRIANLLAYKSLSIDQFLNFLDSATSKSTSGIKVTDGAITSTEFKVGLQNIVKTLDKSKHRHMKFNSKDYIKILRHINPNSDGRMAPGSIKARFMGISLTSSTRSSSAPEGLDNVAIALAVQEQEQKEQEQVAAFYPDDITADDINLLLEELKPKPADGESVDVNLDIVDLQDLEKLLKLSRRNNAKKRLDEKGVAVLFRVQKLLKKLDSTLDEFFAAYQKNGSITGVDMKKGVQQMCRDCKVSLFSENDLHFMIRFLDPSGDGDMSEIELDTAFLKAQQLTGQISMPGGFGDVLLVSKVITKLEVFMKKKGMRSSDLFYLLDRGGTGKLSFKMLKNGLERLFYGQSYQDKEDAIELLATAEADEAKEAQNHLLSIQAKDSRFKLLNDCGASDVLLALEAVMKDKGLRVHDVFHMIDPSNEGVITRAALISGLASLIVPTKHITASKLAKEKKLNRERGEKAVLKVNMNDFLARIEAAEACGAAAVIARLEKYMRKRQMKLSNLFSVLDYAGDGFVSGTELQKTLAKGNLLLSDNEVTTIVEFLDHGGDGVFDINSLEDAIRCRRRFNWEKKQSGGLLFKAFEVQLLTGYIGSSVVDVEELESVLKLSKFYCRAGESDFDGGSAGLSVIVNGNENENAKEADDDLMYTNNSLDGSRLDFDLARLNDSGGEDLKNLDGLDGRVSSTNADQDQNEILVDDYLSGTREPSMKKEDESFSVESEEVEVEQEQEKEGGIKTGIGNLKLDAAIVVVQPELLRSDSNCDDEREDVSAKVDTSLLEKEDLVSLVDTKDKEIEMLMGEIRRLKGEGSGVGGGE